MLGHDRLYSGLQDGVDAGMSAVGSFFNLGGSGTAITGTGHFMIGPNSSQEAWEQGQCNAPDDPAWVYYGTLPYPITGSVQANRHVPQAGDAPYFDAVELTISGVTPCAGVSVVSGSLNGVFTMGPWSNFDTWAYGQRSFICTTFAAVVSVPGQTITVDAVVTIAGNSGGLMTTRLRDRTFDFYSMFYAAAITSGDPVGTKGNFMVFPDKSTTAACCGVTVLTLFRVYAYGGQATVSRTTNPIATSRCLPDNDGVYPDGSIYVP